MKRIRLNFPQWQGGMNQDYVIGSELMSVIVPPSEIDQVFDIDVTKNFDQDENNKHGIDRYDELLKQKKQVETILSNESPDEIITIGGDCSVSEVPFEYLIKKYGDQLGILWIDAHPDIQEIENSKHYHEMVLSDLMGFNDETELTKVERKIKPDHVFYIGLIKDDLLETEGKVLELGFNILTPYELVSKIDKVISWIKDNNIKYLAVHWDLDVLDPYNFRSNYPSEPRKNPEEFFAAIGRMELEDVEELLTSVSEHAKIVGLTIAEHLPWDAINLRRTLSNLSIFKQE